MVNSKGNPEPPIPSDGVPTRDLRTESQAGLAGAAEPPNIVRKDNITFDGANPNIARAVRRTRTTEADRPTYDEYVARMRRAGSLDLVEGSDSERTGTTWGLPGVDDWPTVLTPDGVMPEGYGPGRAEPNRNTGRRGAADPTYMVGSWSTIDDNETRTSGGSPGGSA
jgi:hypothetical protein